MHNNDDGSDLALLDSLANCVFLSLVQTRQSVFTKPALGYLWLGGRSIAQQRMFCIGGIPSLSMKQAIGYGYQQSRQGLHL